MSVHFEVSGMKEFARDLERAATHAPKELQRDLNKIKEKFKANMINRAKETYKTTEHITSGFQMSQVNVEKGKMYSYFRPEAKGKDGHAWHLQEYGYNLTRPRWKSRKRAIEYKRPGEKIKFVQGHHLIDKEIPKFDRYMHLCVGESLKRILDKENL